MIMILMSDDDDVEMTSELAIFALGDIHRRHVAWTILSLRSDSGRHVSHVRYIILLSSSLRSFLSIDMPYHVRVHTSVCVYVA